MPEVDATMVLMKQFILTASVSASLAFAQGTAPRREAEVATRSPVTAGSPAGRPAGAPAAAPAVAPDKVVLTVGTEKVTAKEFDSYIEGLPEQLRQQARGPLKRQMAEQIVRVKLLSQEGKKAASAEDPAMKSRIAFQMENLLAGAAYNDCSPKRSRRCSAKKYYDEHKNEWEEVSARHILIKYKGSPVPAREGKPELTEEQALAKAQEIRKKKIVDGEDFAALAKAESDDAVGSQWWRTGYLQAEFHGSGVREDRVCLARRPGQRADQDPVRLSHHQSRKARYAGVGQC